VGVQCARNMHLADQHSHAQVLEGSGVAVAALLDPEVAHAQGLVAKPLRPEQVAVAFEHTDDVVVADSLQQ